MDEEQVIVVNEHNEEIAIVSRLEMRQHNLLHRASYVIIFNSRDEILIQKRSETKDLYPGYYDPTTGGVVGIGETYADNAKRELEEELGISNVELNFVEDFLFRDASIQVWGRLFWVRYDGGVTFNDGEVVEVSFIPVNEIKLWLSDGQVMPDAKWLLDKLLSENGDLVF
jgi:isopentenyldiphosphate isomerase